MGGRPLLRTGRAGLFPRRQERHAADRVRAAHRPRGPAGRDPGLPRQHRRPHRVHRGRAASPRQVQALAANPDRGPRNDHLGAHRSTARAGRPGLDHLPTGAGDRQARRRRRAVATIPVRPAGPRRDHPPRLPRRTAHRLPQPAPGHRTSPQTRSAARRHRDPARPPGHRRGRRAASRGRPDRHQD